MRFHHCEVSQTVLDDLVLKPRVHPPDEQGDSMLIVSTIPKDEMKAKTNEKLDAIYSQFQEVRVPWRHHWHWRPRAAIGASNARHRFDRSI